ncbi:hypothetical protein C4J89_1980 [Pseudomonas sp. R4-35-07]|nr:hypothetical protein C4J92_1965 [Pseudomonas sp. R3-18-08]AZF26089.1 hypothetical protein C4J90_1916 [Pseudomonas sp. R2-60-08W]AZF31455.1 hypothetical protein C4J89_1980 [Pseudomonas sp. R4-35-07]AZF36732.1 hypothetical protein C4J88_1949 [Pseudomonas sp. R4-39-08]AZF52398.1 hypothetical protein C4J85_1913 [Pseudomonas sp. R4-34-07]MDQ0980226.1 hypothetical protein [Pseudomonas synxantha]
MPDSLTPETLNTLRLPIVFTLARGNAQYCSSVQVVLRGCRSIG